MNLIFFLYFFS